jgi:soluble lytic murein transglycosylase-like protein
VNVTDRARALAHGAGVPLLVAGVAMAAAPGLLTIRVERGDTLSELALRHRTTVAELVRLNALPGNGDVVYAGQALRVPTAHRTRTPAASSNLVHVVQPGQTLLGIAHRYSIDPKAIAARNVLPPSLVIRIGQRLTIPSPRRAVRSARPAASSFAGRTYPPAVLAAAARNRAALAARPVPSRAAVRALIRATALRLDVDPALAVAVAYQESGFNQRRVSVANAIGAMQVLPSTARYLSRDILGGRRLDLLRAEDNVLAGVLLLRQLLRVAPPDRAVAGYYQGLASIRANGMHPDTKAYVANVLALRERMAAR